MERCPVYESTDLRNELCESGLELSLEVNASPETWSFVLVHWFSLNLFTIKDR